VPTLLGGGCLSVADRGVEFDDVEKLTYTNTFANFVEQFNLEETETRLCGPHDINPAKDNCKT
jgi:hypothetical protein